MQGDRNDACVCERVGVYKKEMENKEVNLINKRGLSQLIMFELR